MDGMTFLLAGAVAVAVLGHLLGFSRRHFLVAVGVYIVSFWVGGVFLVQYLIDRRGTDDQLMQGLLIVSLVCMALALLIGRGLGHSRPTVPKEKPAPPTQAEDVGPTLWEPRNPL